MNPSTLRNWTASRDAWEAYDKLLKEAANTLEAKIAAYVKKMNAKGVAFDGAQYRSYRQAMLREIKAHIAGMEAALQGPVDDIMKRLQAREYEFINQTAAPGLAGSFTAFSDLTGLIIANTEIDLGKQLGRMVKEYGGWSAKKTDDLLRKAEGAIRRGEIEGLSIGELTTEFRQNIIGLAPHQRMKGVTHSVNQLLRTQQAQVHFDVMNGFGLSLPEIIGVKMQRGPGECPSEICGEALGLAKNEIGIFIYGVNDPPQPPFHPHCYCTVVGYVFAGDREAIAQAERFAANELRRSKLYSAFVTGRDEGREAAKRFLKSA